MLKSHKLRLNPTTEQTAYFFRAAGTSRYAYNWAVAKWREAVGKKPSAMQLKKQFNAEKPDWAYEVTKCAPEGAFFDFGAALQKHYKRGLANLNSRAVSAAISASTSPTTSSMYAGTISKYPSWGW